MKTLRLFLIASWSVASLLPISALGQGGGFGRPGDITTARAAAEAGGDLKRFDLNFPGGTPDQFVAAISHALGQPLNAIVPNDQKNAIIMPIKVFGVTVPELFSALETASASERPMVTSSVGPSRSIQFRNVSMGFRPNVSNITDQTVWSFYSTELTPAYLEALGEAQQPEQVCQYFQLAPYLMDHSIDDITTAIQTGWKLLKISPMPQLSFHEETKLLIAVGPPAQIAQIPPVLEQLQRDNTATSVKVSQLQDAIRELAAKKEAGWEQKTDELQRQITELTREQKAREQIRVPGSNSPFGPSSGGGRGLVRPR